ncbi:hypothetical protein BDW22DRAFT_314140 [Trametopsis cervina]|nr:hypothetical protein BDW22DRAFT_314140 [Trametopsis cervina]
MKKVLQFPIHLVDLAAASRLSHLFSQRRLCPSPYDEHALEASCSVPRVQLSDARALVVNSAPVLAVARMQVSGCGRNPRRVSRTSGASNELWRVRSLPFPTTHLPCRTACTYPHIAGTQSPRQRGQRPFSRYVHARGGTAVGMGMSEVGDVDTTRGSCSCQTRRRLDT